jgi:hypothetical protein
VKGARSRPLTDLDALLRSLEPELHPGVYVFATLPPAGSIDPADVVASVREAEGVSVVVEESVAERLGIRPVLRCAWITLTVHSDLQAVGLTAAFSSALGAAGIACNVVAGTNHDHLFVPVEQAAAAMEALRAMQRGDDGR